MDIGRSGYAVGRLVAVGAGLLAFLIAVTAAATLTPLEGIVAALVDRVGYDWIVAAVLGVLALLVGFAVFVSGRGSTMRGTEMPTVERPVPVPAAGEPFDETVDSWRFATQLFGGDTATAVRERLRSAAVATVATEEGCSRARARERVDAGTWTDDEVAAGFIAGRHASLGTWFVALANGETGPAYRTRRTVEAIVALREGDPRDDASVDGPGAERSETSGAEGAQVVGTEGADAVGDDATGRDNTAARREASQ